MMKMYLIAVIIILLAACIVISEGMISIVTADSGSVSYIYDDLGRLIKVEYSNGTIATYTYDAAGNRLTATVTVTKTIEISLKAGWNMVSVPLQLSANSTSSVFPGAAGIFAWNPVSKTYFAPSVIEPNKGYWVAATSNITINLTGTPVDTWASDLKAGWNMVGSISANTSTSSPNDNPDSSVIPTLYWWDPISKNYVPTTTIEPGKGFWVAATQDSTLTVP